MRRQAVTDRGAGCRYSSESCNHSQKSSQLGDHGLQQRPLQRRPRAGGVARLEIAVLIEDEHVGEIPVRLARKLVLGQLEDRVRPVPVDRGLGEQREVGPSDQRACASSGQLYDGRRPQKIQLYVDRFVTGNRSQYLGSTVRNNVF